MERDKKNSFDACFIDFFAILAANFILISLLLARNLADEYFEKVNLYEQKMTNTQIGLNLDMPVLDVLMKGDGSLSFVLKSKTFGAHTFGNTSAVKKVLKKYKPGWLRLRVDQRVQSGILQELLFDAKELGIHAKLSVKKKN